MRMEREMLKKRGQKRGILGKGLFFALFL